ncbi:hypothetical protein DENSPDRAFT_586384 [Dentipellis sp. KUC8613]|nr:hypothetical protein DENSPDRAFT_586384 [Dentipellis sp. KUC8613]
MSPTLDRVVLGSFVAESTLYGISMTMGAVTALVLIRARSEGGRAHKTLLFTLFLMLILATSHVALSFAQAFLGFINMHDVPGGPLAYFSRLSGPVFVAKMALFPLQSLMGDTVWIWRCYVIWGRSKKVIIVPMMTLITSSVCACIVEVVLVRSSVDLFRAPNHWVISGFVLLLVTAIYCNVAIICRILRTDARNRSHILIVIVEAGLLYTSSLFTFLVLYSIQSTGETLALDLIIPFVPIVFCLVILQIKYHNTDEASGPLVQLDNLKRPRTGVPQAFRRPERFRLHPSVGSMKFEPQPVMVNILESMEDHREDEAAGVGKNSFLGGTASEV